MMQTELAIHRAPNGRLPPLRMLDQGATLDAEGERAPVGLSLPALLGLETMQLPMMPDEGSHAHQLCVIGSRWSSNRSSRQHPGVYAMSFPDLCSLLARFLETQLLPQGFRFVALLSHHGCELAEFLVKPLFAHLQRRKALIPPLLATGCCFDVLDRKNTDWKQCAEKGGQAQFPLPACLGRRREFFLALMPIVPGLATRRVSPATSATHPGRVLFCFLDSLPGLRLEIDIGMGRRDDAIALAFAAG